MAWLTGEKKFGQYTYDHWYDEEHQEPPPKNAKDESPSETENQKEPERNHEEGTQTRI